MTRIIKYQTKHQLVTATQATDFSGKPIDGLREVEIAGISMRFNDHFFDVFFEEVPKKQKRKGRKKNNHRQLDDEHYDGVEIWDTPKY